MHCCSGSQLIYSAFLLAAVVKTIRFLIYLRQTVPIMVFQDQNVAKLLTTHGFGFAATTKGFGKLFVICVTLTSFAFGMSQIANTFQAFLLFDAKTAITVDPFESIEFPAITICPASIFKRNEIGNQIGNVAAVYSIAYRVGLAGSMQISHDICADSNAPNESFDFDKLSDIRRVFFDSVKTVMQCNLNGKPLNCSRLFLNRNTELGYCFTFNQAPNILSQYTIEGLPIPDGRYNGYDSYGTSPNDTANVTLRSGLRNSLQILFNINMSQTCVPISQYLVGMAAIVHDPSIQPFLSTKPFTMLPPGFATNVAITFRRNQRNTESIGKCRSQLSLKWFPNSTDYINKDDYIINCLTDIVVRKCHCLPYFCTALSKYVQIGVRDICASTAATIYQADCQQSAFDTEYLTERTCYHRNPIPCQEYIMSSNSVSKLYPSPNMLASLKRNLSMPDSMNLTEFRQNFVLANFYVKRKEVIQVTEDPAMTWIDLLNKAGGTLGMCLGMSLISLVELITLVPLSFIYWLRNAYGRHWNWNTTAHPQYRP